MPIIGWYCPSCKARVPLDHFDTCGAVHPDYASAVLTDSRDGREGVHVSHGLGCVRRSVIEDTADVWVNPLDYNALVGGTGWHRLMQESSKFHHLCEVEVRGVVGGVQLTGKVDRLHPPTAISDWKTTSEWAEKWLNKPKDEGGGMKREHLAQLSLYAELIEQSLGWRPTFGVVWYRTQKTILHFAENLWDLAATLAFRPHDCDFTVEELLHQAASGADWKTLPLVGESVKFGAKTGCDYCSVRDTCKTQAYGAPF